MGGEQVEPVAHAPVQVVEQRERGIVGPVQVVDKEEHGAQLAGRPENLGNPLEEAAAAALGVQLRRLRQLAVALARLRDDARQLGQPKRIHVAEIDLRDSLPQCLGHWAIGQRTLRLVAARPQDGHIIQRQALEELIGEPGLADAGATHQRHGPRLAGQHPVPFLSQGSQLPLPAHERWFGEDRALALTQESLRAPAATHRTLPDAFGQRLGLP